MNVRFPITFRYLQKTAMALLIALALAQTTIFERASLALRDGLMLQTTPTQVFDEVVFIDVDEDSMAVIAARFGAWPFSRELYATVSDYLFRAGAKAIAIDILFAESRAGDGELAGALHRRPAVLAAAALPTTVERGKVYLSRLAAAAWRIPPQLQRHYWPDITLPADGILTATGDISVGVVTGPIDPIDGQFRRLSLFHESHGHTLPSLPLAALLAGEHSPEIAFEAGAVRAGMYRWPVNAQGEVHLRFSKAIEGLSTVPFYQVLLAAEGDRNFANIERIFKDKIVIVGSTAERLGDYVQTPRGQMGGGHVAAMSFEMLKHGWILTPPSWGGNALLIACGLLLPALSFFNRFGNSTTYAWLVPPLTVVLVFAVAALLFRMGRETEVLFPLVLAFTALTVDRIGRVRALQRIRRELAGENLAAARAHELKSQFMSHMTHELRTPLTAIMGFNDKLAEARLNAGEHARCVEIVDRNSRHLLSLINNLLDGTKLEAGQMRIALAPTAIRELIGDVVQTLTPLAEAKGLKLSAEVNAEVPAGLALDAMRIKQILLNLIGNAIKFTMQGQVTVTLGWREDRLSLTVADTGTGIRAEHLDRIFVPFQQAHERVAQKFGGTGLGLSISRGLCHLMGGSLTVNSEPGKGSTFTATVQSPIAILPATIAPVPPPRTAQSVSGQAQKRLLVADDSEEIRMLLEYFLEQGGFSVVLAEDGARAVELALHERPDMVLTDLEMPELTGIEVARDLRNAGYTSPIVLLTAHPEGAEVELALHAGCNTYLAKPIERDVLLNTIDRLLAAAVTTAQIR